LFKFLNDPVHDGVKRAKQLKLDSKVISELLESIGNQNHASKGLLLVIDGESEDGKIIKTGDEFLELSAQLLEKRNITVYRVKAPKDLSKIPPELSSFKPGKIILYYNGRKYFYHGRRDALSLLSFVLKLHDMNQVKSIEGKIDKVAFDAIQEPKLVGFFMPNTPDYNEYVAAASLFSPSVQFFVVTKRNVAKHLKLDTVGQIIMVKPFEKAYIVCPQNPATLADIEAFVNENRGIALTYLNEHNLHDPTIFNNDKKVILAITESNSPFGVYFHKLITKVIKNVTGVEEPKSSKHQKHAKAAAPEQKPENIFKNLSIVWVDLEQFPTLYLLRDQLEKSLNFTPNLPFYFGLVNVSSNQSVWFNTSSLNTTGDKGADEENIRSLKDWLTGIATNTIKPATIGAQTFIKVPENIQVNEGDDFTLECIVENPIGDCLWMKDGQNIGFNLSRYANHYSWRSETGSGDCSLVVKRANIEQDDGEWVCEVTGDQNNPTITSSPAVVTVKATSKTEL
ncbi:Calsequestrin-2-like protein, partial [Dinothrombium tinctorium]